MPRPKILRKILYYSVTSQVRHKSQDHPNFTRTVEHVLYHHLLTKIRAHIMYTKANLHS